MSLEGNLFTATGPCVTIAATSTTDRVAIGAKDTLSGTVWVYNAGGEAAWISFGDSTVTAATTGRAIPVGAGQARPFALPNRATHVAAITASGNCDVYFTPGRGV